MLSSFKLVFRFLGKGSDERLVCLLLRPLSDYLGEKVPCAADGEEALEIALKCKLGNL